MLNSITAVILVAFVAVAAFSIAMAGYFYSSMSAGLESKATAAAGFFRNTVESEFRSASARYVQNFDENDQLELQILTPYGRITLSSYGLTAGTTPGTPEIAQAVSSGQMKLWSGNDPVTEEHIMAVSAPITYNSSVVGVVRFVTSLRAVDRQLVLIIAIAAAAGLVAVALVYFSNLYFVKSIVDPVLDITDTAKRIAGGSYGVQLQKRHDDEIGDLTDAINDMSAKIAQSEKIKSEFISSVSHELRTPLTAINGWAETIMNGEVREAADVKKGMGIIVSEARRLTNMVEELLEFSRLEDGRFTLSVEPLDIAAEFEDAIYTYREFFRREGLSLNYDPCEEELLPVTGDPERLRQVFCNILDNASKHGGGGMQIDCSLCQEDDYIVIRIRDHGPGIPEEELPRVKMKFYKGSSKARGSGIGLAVSEEIISRHGGRLDIDNAPGGGCLVTIRLPFGS